MKKIVFATNNAHKLSEIRAICGDTTDIVGLADIGCHDEIPETGDTLLDNARQKARYIRDKFGIDCFADDTGLMVDALGGEPGVRSARYAGGDGHDSAANMALLLRRMEGKTDRKARFVTEIVLLLDGAEHRFTGEVEGEILTTPTGDGGFGYDPVFKPIESDAPSFATMTPDEKNAISHRGRATRRLLDFLSDKYKSNTDK